MDIDVDACMIWFVWFIVLLIVLNSNLGIFRMNFYLHGINCFKAVLVQGRIFPLG